MLLAVALVLVSIVLLYYSSLWTVKHSVHLTHLLGWSSFAFGLLFVSLSTSLPELGVVVFSILDEAPGLTIGNALGSTFFDLTIVLAVIIFAAGSIALKRKELFDLIELLFVCALVPVLIFQFGELTLLHGIVLLCLYGVYVFHLLSRGQMLKMRFSAALELTAIKFALSVAVLLYSTKLLVDNILIVGDALGIAPALLGVTIVSASTSLPEIAVELQAIKEREFALALGDLFGSAITNISLILGLGAILTAGGVFSLAPLVSLLPFLLTATLFIWYVFSRHNRVTKRDAVILISLYALFLLSEIFSIGFGLA